MTVWKVDFYQTKFLPSLAGLLLLANSLCRAEPPPPPWTGTDVGAIDHKGGVEFAGGAYKLNGSGAEIWETNDSFYFVSQPFTGNGAIIAHFKEGLKFVDPSAKAGVMIRASLDANAANAFLAVTSLRGATFQQRNAAGNSTTSKMIEGKFSSAADGSGLWLKLERTGDTVTASTSEDGKEWKIIDAVKIELPTEASIGLAMTTHDAAQQYGFATFDHVEVTLNKEKK